MDINTGCLNRITLIGYVGGEPKIDTLANDQKKCQFSLATTSAYLGRRGERIEHTSFHRIVMFGGLATKVAPNIKKGSRLYLEGMYQVRTYEKEGIKYTISEVLVSSLMFLDKKEKP